MNIERERLKWAVLAFALTLLVLHGGPVAAQTTEYWVVPHPGVARGAESFVIQVDQAKAAQIEQIRSAGGISGFSGEIAASTISYNKNFHAPGHPAWNWYVSSINLIFDHNTAFWPGEVDPNFESFPSDIAANPQQWISDNGPGYKPRYFRILSQIDSSNPSRLANISNRNFTGPGEKVPIMGFILSGGEPRNVIVRAMGPSLSQAGIQQPLSDPRISVFAGATQIAQNNDWQEDPNASVITNSYPTLAPSNNAEAALYLTLAPGAYTIHSSNEEASDGVVLTEVYDVTD